MLYVRNVGITLLESGLERRRLLVDVANGLQITIGKL